MATNPQAEGQTRINFQISDEEKRDLESLAAASKMKLSAYVRMVLSDALQSGTIFTQSRIDARPARIEAETLQFVAAPLAPYGEKNPPLGGKTKKRQIVNRDENTGEAKSA